MRPSKFDSFVEEKGRGSARPCCFGDVALDDRAMA